MNFASRKKSRDVLNWRNSSKKRKYRLLSSIRKQACFKLTLIIEKYKRIQCLKAILLIKRRNQMGISSLNESSLIKLPINHIRTLPFVMKKKAIFMFYMLTKYQEKIKNVFTILREKLLENRRGNINFLWLRLKLTGAKRIYRIYRRRHEEIHTQNSFNKWKKFTKLQSIFTKHSNLLSNVNEDKTKSIIYSKRGSVVLTEDQPKFNNNFGSKDNQDPNGENKGKDDDDHAIGKILLNQHQENINKYLKSSEFLEGNFENNPQVRNFKLSKKQLSSFMRESFIETIDKKYINIYKCFENDDFERFASLFMEMCIDVYSGMNKSVKKEKIRYVREVNINEINEAQKKRERLKNVSMKFQKKKNAIKSLGALLIN